MSAIKQILEEFSSLEELVIKIKVNPKAKKNEISSEIVGARLKVSLVAAPENNKANEALLKFLAKKLGLRRYQVEIIAGHKDRLKTIKLRR